MVKKWQNITYQFFSTKKQATTMMRSHKGDTEHSKKYAWRVKKKLGRNRPFGKKRKGYQIQFRKKTKRIRRKK